MEYTNLSLDEIRRQLEEAESKQAELNRLLAVRRHEGRDEVIQQIREIIDNNGYEYDEIVPYLIPKRGRGRRPSLFTQSKPSSFSTRQYTRYVDPDNAENVYVRGVLPAWMKQKMQEQGYDPSSKTDRETFKANSLRVLEG
ncbi:H-NS histone family protein [Thiobaca trueperi]|uniref:DNA-binding protein H-NS n=1 Tax=Thiobaca trueperi TaxID=127458 RepID=A0A4R3N3Y6_9GAMM|nr:H-NS histone family protein [Thiobaca trueperi]TCT22736.1 DNA-binding protein H-NS [Thiobaca trueperi]